MKELDPCNVRMVRPGVWRARQYLRTDRSTGRAVRPSETFAAADHEDACRQARVWWSRQQLAAGRGGGTALGDMAMNRINMLESLGAIDRSTARAYRGKLALYVEPAIGRMDAGEVRVSDVNDLYVHLLESGGRRGNGLSPATVRVVHALLRGCYQSWVTDGIVAANPAMMATPPPMPDAKARSLEPDELEAVANELAAVMHDGSTEPARAEQRSAATAAYLALHLGLRAGEACALRWRDIDTKGMSAYVCGSVAELGGPPLLKSKPKRKSMRHVAFGKAVAAELKSCLEWQKRLLDGVRRDTTVCCAPDGGLLRPSAASKAFGAMCACLGVQGATFHTLRHTHATIVLAQGADVKTTAERLGHARASTTTDIYAHAMPGRDAAASEGFERYMEGIG
ncbi:MAG: site-specific integrase [Eggerthellaceae bacterium]|nr:site-specific integrase [Eggerthellaceae bacterium]